MSVPDELFELICRADNDTHISPTLVYNEGWMLRLVLYAAENGHLPETFPVASDAKLDWYSESQLPTAFGRKWGHDTESNTHADGVIAQFERSRGTKSGFRLCKDATRFEVLEAKMASKLSRGTKRAKYFDQVARTIACMANSMQQISQTPDKFAKVGFFVLAPEQQIEKGLFEEAIKPETILAKIQLRIQNVSGGRREWLNHWREGYVRPLIEEFQQRGSIRILSWECLCREIQRSDISLGRRLWTFYSKCLRHNGLIPCSDDGTSSPPPPRPIRGLEYHRDRPDGPPDRVRVCCPGRVQSRVISSNYTGESELVANAELKAISKADQTLRRPDPVIDEEYYWIDKQGRKKKVRITRVGLCNSRVKDESGSGFLVPNHKLEKTE